MQRHWTWEEMGENREEQDAVILSMLDMDNMSNMIPSHDTSAHKRSRSHRGKL
jgi:hypothetical protein